MVDVKINKLPKSTLELEFTISQEEVKKQYEKSFAKAQAKLKIDGFREGKVPLDIAKKHIDKQKVYDDVAHVLINDLYAQALKDNNIQPLTRPKVTQIDAKEEEDWKVKLMVAVTPKVNLSGYKEKIKQATAEFKESKIWTPDQEAKVDDKESAKKRDLAFQKAIEVILRNVECEISDILIDEMVERKLVELMDEIKKIGLTIEAYLRAKNIDIEGVKANLRKEVEEAYKLEFALMQIAEEEKITVEEKDIDAVIATFKTDKDKEDARKHAYYFAPIIRKQKVIDFLLSL